MDRLQGYNNSLVRTGLVLSLYASTLLLRGSVPVTSVSECIDKLEMGAEVSELDITMSSLCAVYDELPSPNEYGTADTVPLEELDVPPEAIETIESLIAPIRPFSAESNFRFRISASDGGSFISGSVAEGTDPYLSITPSQAASPTESGEVLRWVAFHESTHTVETDKKFSSFYYGWNNFPLSQIEPYRRSANAVDPSPLDEFTKCPSGYGSTIYGLFDESSYVPGAECAEGHPYSNDGEFTASAITVMHLFPARFIEKYYALDATSKKHTKEVIKEVVELTKRINPAQKAVDELIPTAIQDLAA